METRIVNLLVFLMKTGSRQCLPNSLFPINEERLLTIANRNKAIPFLFHFINCPSCRKKIKTTTLKRLSDYQKFVSIWPLLYQNEKKQLGKFCQKNKVKAVLIKDFSSYPKMNFHQQFLMGVDLDLLIKKSNTIDFELFLKKQGYQLEKHLKIRNKNGKTDYQEKNFFHPQKKVSIDLHYQIAIPHKDEFNFLPWETIKRLSKKILQNSSQQKNGLSIPQKEYFLLILLAHYLGSDILKGLRSLFDIIQFINLYGQEINWGKFLQLCQQFKITNFSCFIFLLGSRIFNLKLPQNFQRKTQISFRTRFLSFCWPVEKIAIFPSPGKWHLKNKEAGEIFYENFFLKLLLADSVPLRRLIRPRIFLFCLKILFLRFNKALSHLYQRYF